MRRFGIFLIPIALVVAAVLGVVTSADGATSPAKVTWSKGPALPASWTARWDYAVAYHPPSGKVVLFGGSPAQPGGSWHDDTWELTGDSWAEGGVAAPGLTPRGGATMAYYPPTGDLVMFGGAGQEWPPSNETWLYDGNRWRRGPDAPEGMQGRTGAMMAYYPPTGDLVLFGGSGDLAFTDTWLFDGTGWRAGPDPAKWPAPGILPRSFGGMTFDGRVGLIVLTGGSASNDSWYFNGRRWTKAPFLPDALGAKERVDLEYHPGYKRSVMFGGLGPGRATDELWMLDRGGVWRQLEPGKDAVRPDLRFDAQLVWVEHRNKMLMIGGVHHRGTGTDVYRETWWMN